MTSTPEPSAAPSRWDALTAREAQVARAIALEMTNREIAEQLSISIKTVDTHRMHALKKLGVRNNVALARFALREKQVVL